MAQPLESTESAAKAIARVRYSHDAMIDLILQNPAISQAQIAGHFGYTQPWVSRIFNSDAFQARLAQRKTELVDPTIALSLDEKFRALADRSLDILQEKLQTGNPDLAIKALDLSAKALGYGARAQNVAVQQNFVVALPPKAADASAWAQAHGGGSLPTTPQLSQVPSSGPGLQNLTIDSESQRIPA